MNHEEIELLEDIKKELEHIGSVFERINEYVDIKKYEMINNANNLQLSRSIGKGNTNCEKITFQEFLTASRQYLRG